MNKQPLDKFSELVCVYFAGPSGSGKTYLAKELVKAYPYEFHRPLQVTTRDRRPNEVSGNDYKFVDEELYNHLYNTRQLCCVTKVNGKYYGTFYDKLKQDKINIIVVDKGGYETRPENTNSELLIGLDYYPEVDDNNRILGREDRDQRSNFESLKNEYHLDALFWNNSKNYITVENLRKCIYKLFMQKEIFEPCFKFKPVT